MPKPETADAIRQGVGEAAPNVPPVPPEPDAVAPDMVVPAEGATMVVAGVGQVALLGPGTPTRPHAVTAPSADPTATPVASLGRADGLVLPVGVAATPVPVEHVGRPVAEVVPHPGPDEALRGVGRGEVPVTPTFLRPRVGGVTVAHPAVTVLAEVVVAVPPGTVLVPPARPHGLAEEVALPVAGVTFGVTCRAVRPSARPPGLGPPVGTTVVQVAAVGLRTTAQVAEGLIGRP